MVRGKDYRGRVIIMRLDADNTHRRLEVGDLVCVFEEDVLLPGGCAGRTDVLLICTPENYGEFVSLTNGSVNAPTP